MNKDQIKGAAKDLAGKIQQEGGKLIGNPTQEAKGVAKQIKGKAQQHLGNAKELVKDAKKV
ncbi:MAG: CsbD family protein [Giesbergeria sp.]|jgi:uncharacterized protein YjbJ (UPF0337 family)|nr:CsbD family protein [Simplicispira sp.]